MPRKPNKIFREPLDPQRTKHSATPLKKYRADFLVWHHDGVSGKTPPPQTKTLEVLAPNHPAACKIAREMCLDRHIFGLSDVVRIPDRNIRQTD